MKRPLRIVTLAAGVLILSTGVAMAKPDRDMDRPGTMCPAGAAYSQLTPEKQQLFRSIMMEHQDKVAPLRDQLKVKRMELKALSRNPNTQPEHISKVSAEIGDLMSKIRAEKTAIRVRLDKEVGFMPPMMMGDMPGHGKCFHKGNDHGGRHDDHMKHRN